MTTASNGTRHCDDGSGGDIIGPDLTVTQTYNHDYVSAVTTNLPGDLPRIDLDYADNLQIKKVLYANGTESFYQKDPWGMPRPRKITHKKGSTKYFSRNIYRYDGAGNLWQAGTDTYTYDKAGRLLSGQFLSAGITLREDYQYDAADTLVSVSTGGTPRGGSRTGGSPGAAMTTTTMTMTMTTMMMTMTERARGSRIPRARLRHARV